MNFSPEPAEVRLDQHTYTDLIAGGGVSGTLSLEPYGVRVLVRE
jgi:beta-galactosidase GanA